MNVDVPGHVEHGQMSQIPQKGSVLSRNDQKWESLQGEIYRIYMTEHSTLPKTMLLVEEKYGFTAS